MDCFQVGKTSFDATFKHSLLSYYSFSVIFLYFAGCICKYSKLLEGAHTWTPTMHIKLVQDLGVDNVVAEHLSETYGDRAFEVGRNASMTGLRWPVVGKRLNPEYPYIEAEVITTQIKIQIV